ncbi:MAG: transposase [Anaerolineae bacterium]|nr:transposase [Anaerolineae bacterium]MCO5194159.1 transposase [Anaerolineae bacterium]MCO5205412.1 transposase [Anaerolineae bacterium]
MVRPRRYSEREMFNAILYILRTGCSWRMMPHDLPPRDAVYQSTSASSRNVGFGRN